MEGKYVEWKLNWKREKIMQMRKKTEVEKVVLTYSGKNSS